MHQPAGGPASRESLVRAIGTVGLAAALLVLAGFAAAWYAAPVAAQERPDPGIRPVPSCQARCEQAAKEFMRKCEANGGTDCSAQARKMLAAGRDPREVLDFLAATLTNRLLHGPSQRLREAAERGDGDIIRAARALFAPEPARAGKETDTPASSQSTQNPKIEEH